VAFAAFGEDYAGYTATGCSADTAVYFTGQGQFTMNGLYDFPFREYEANQGRWISPDPKGLAAVNPINPQTWNRYAYVINNPLALTDPLGLDCNDGKDLKGTPGECPGPTDLPNPIHVDVIDGLGLMTLWYDDFFNPEQGVTIASLNAIDQDRIRCQLSRTCAPQGFLNYLFTHFTLGVRQTGQSYTQCLSANSTNYSAAGAFNVQNSAGQLLLGNDIASIAFGYLSEGVGGAALWEGGSGGFAGGVGTAGTAFRRSASIFDLNLEGVTGRAPMILGKTGAEEIVGMVSCAAEFKFFGDVGFTTAEAIGCAISAN
jgi:RHS repeat-associated protein